MSTRLGRVGERRGNDYPSAAVDYESGPLTRG
jgi:hypothetical protein